MEKGSFPAGFSVSDSAHLFSVARCGAMRLECKPGGGSVNSLTGQRTQFCTSSSVLFCIIVGRRKTVIPEQFSGGQQNNATKIWRWQEDC